VKFVDDLVLLAKEEMVLQGMIERLTEIRRHYGMEMNVEKTKIMRMSRRPSPIQIVMDQKQLENVEYLNYLGSMITNDARCTREIKSRIAMVKAAFNKKKNIFHQQIGLQFKGETKLIRNTWKVLECGAGEEWRRSVGPIV
jgi:hypothetical protein